MSLGRLWTSGRSDAIQRKSSTSPRAINGAQRHRQPNAGGVTRRPTKPERTRSVLGARASCGWVPSRPRKVPSVAPRLQHGASDLVPCRILVVPGPQRDPLLTEQRAPGRGYLGQLLEVALPWRAGREQDEHGGIGVAVVVEAVDAALRDVEEVTGLGIYPLGAVEQFDGAFEDVEGLGEGLVDVRRRVLRPSTPPPCRRSCPPAQRG